MDLLCEAINAREREGLEGPPPTKIFKTEYIFQDSNPYHCQSQAEPSQNSNQLWSSDNNPESPNQNRNTPDPVTLTADELLKNYLMDQICIDKLRTFVLVQIEYSLTSSDIFLKTRNSLDDLIKTLRDKETGKFLALLGKCLVEKFATVETVNTIPRESVIKALSQEVAVRAEVPQEPEAIDPEVIAEYFIPTLAAFDAIPNSPSPNFIQNDVVQLQLQNESNHHLVAVVPDSIQLNDMANDEESNAGWECSIQSVQSLNPNVDTKMEFSESSVIIPNSAPIIDEQQFTEVMEECSNSNQAESVESTNQNQLILNEMIPEDPLNVTEETVESKPLSTSANSNKNLITQKIIDEIRSEIAVSSMSAGKEQNWKHLSRAWTEKLFVRLFTLEEITEGTLSGRNLKKYDAAKVHCIAKFLGWLKSKPQSFAIDEYRKYDKLTENGIRTGLDDIDMDHFRKVIQHYSYYLRHKEKRK